MLIGTCQALSFELSELQTVTQMSGIRERLISFDVNNIRIKFPDTEESESLLRPEMLDALEEYRPTSKAKFQEYIPGYLRTATSAREGRYLEQVLTMIADFG